MSFSQEAGYLPKSVETIMEMFRVKINEVFSTNYTTENFVGSNHYKFFYAAAQDFAASETKTAEIFAKAQQYFEVTNESIQRPVATIPGVIEALGREGYIASVKPPNNTDAGKIFIAVDVDDTAPGYALVKAAIGTIISRSVALGIPTQGAQVTNITHSNGQAFDYKFDVPNRIPVKLRLTVTLSDNNQLVIESPEWVRDRLFANILARYHLGLDFAPQRYFSTADAPWAAEVKLEYSLNGGTTWSALTYQANYNDVFSFTLGDITIVEA